jgi:hypothetical protein
MPTADPNWLLSTTAQSAAAIVAIVGGFLVSRLVSLSSERHGLRQRRDQLDRIVDLKNAELDELQRRMDSVARGWFVDSAMSDFVDAKGSPDLLQILEKHSKLGSSVEGTTAAAAWLGGLVRAGYAAFERDPDVFTVKADDPVWLAAAGFPVEEGNEEMLTRVARAIVKKERSTRGQFGRMFEIPDLPASARWDPRLGDRAVDRQDARISRRDTLSSDIRALRAEMEIVSSTLAGIGRPEGVVMGIWVLVGFAAVGIVLPLVLLAVRPVPTSPWVRLAVIAGFIGGLGAVVGYIVNAVHRLAAD